MRRSAYREQDHAFGQLMLKLRMAVGLTQSGLADSLHVSRRTVGSWEAGQSYPKVDHLQQFVRLALKQGAFGVGREADEIRALWRSAHQKMLLDEQWLETLLAEQHATLQGTSAKKSNSSNAIGELGELSKKIRPLLDWSDAIDAPTLFGRDGEQALLTYWLTEESCRIVCVVGMGGIGKSALAVSAVRQAAPQFDVVIWRSLRDAPSCEALLDSCMQVLAPQTLLNMPEALDVRLRLLMEQLRDRRVLLIFDDGEALLEEGTRTGNMHPGFEGYTRLLQQMGGTAHQSCLLLISREKPIDLVPLEGNRLWVRMLRLEGINSEACSQLFAGIDLVSSPDDQARLVELYGGNPLALKIVSQTIIDLFGGDVHQFLAQSNLIFSGVRQLLDEQFNRLSRLEQSVLYWFAILREPVTLDELLAGLRHSETPTYIFEAIEGLNRRSMMQRGQQSSSFTLHSVVLEYVTARLVVEAHSELTQGTLDLMISHGFATAQAKDYIRKAQEQLLMLPLLQHVKQTYPQRAELEAHLLRLLDQLRSFDQFAQGYGPANLLGLLLLLRGDLRGLNLSRLLLRNVFLQGVAMQDTNLSHAILNGCVLSESFDDILDFTISHTGTYWAVVSRRGRIWVWDDGGRILRHIWQAYPDMIWQFLAISSDGHSLVSGSSGGGIKLWDMEQGRLCWSKRLAKSILWLTFSPDSRILAAAAFDGVVRLWDAQNGKLIEEIPHSNAIFGLVWHPQGHLLATGDAAGTVRLWRWQPNEAAYCVQTLSGHTHWIAGMAFAPNGEYLASASYDTTIKLWDVDSGSCLHTFTGHTERVMRVAWSPDGRFIASSSTDRTIWLWDVAERRVHAVLRGHESLATGLAFTPDSYTLLSGSDDGTIRVWDVRSRQCTRVIAGHVTALFDIDWSPDGNQLASGGADMLVSLWNTTNAQRYRLLRGHHWIVQGVAWHPGGQLLVSSGLDNCIRVWDVTTGLPFQELRDPLGFDTVFHCVAWSPSGHLLASGTYVGGVQVWDMTSYTQRWVGQTQPTLVHSVAWSIDGTRLASGDDNGNVSLWDVEDGHLLLNLTQHGGSVTSVAWSSDDLSLASGGVGQVGGELVIWDLYQLPMSTPH